MIDIDLRIGRFKFIIHQHGGIAAADSTYVARASMSEEAIAKHPLLNR